jgi:hypothetical protein
MLPHFATRFASRLYRVLDVVCVLLVCSYVFFDVLDIDGSNFLRFLKPTQRFFLIAEAIPLVELENFREPAVFSGDSERSLTGPFININWLLRQTKTLRLSSLISIRIHGYRVGLPRDSVPD